MKIKIWTKATGDVLAELSEIKNPNTVTAILKILPIKTHVSTWGDELYFSIQSKAKAENTQSVVDKGDLAYWPPGDSLCIFFGLTPASRGDEIRPASPVNLVGKVLGDSTVFKKVKENDEIQINKA